MYEFSLTRSVNNAVLGLCKEAGWSKVRRILIKIGGLRKVNPELMACIFSVISEGTPAEGADFSVMKIPVTMHCYSCGHNGYREDSEILCPSCGSNNVKLLSGFELSIEYLEVEKNLE